MTVPDDEIVVIVDEHDREIGATRRAIMRQQRLIHRAAYILVFNDRGRLFVQKRSMRKDVYPGYWDAAAGGVVLAGESYMQAARRELSEELGISTTLQHLFDHYHEDGDNRVWGRVYHCNHNGPFELQEEEIVAGRFMTLEQALALNREQPFTPDSVSIMERLLTADSDDDACRDDAAESAGIGRP